MTQYTDQLNDLAAKIKQVEFGMFTSSNDSRILTSRPMTQQQVDALGNMWFFVSDQEAFTRDLLGNAQVNVAFSDIHDNLYVSVTGRAELLRDRIKAEELWSEKVAAWFPGGLDDPHLALIKVKIQSAEYWDAPSSKMTQFFSMAKAAFTGDRVGTVGEHEKINLL
jgi:general stress protein 26